MSLFQRAHDILQAKASKALDAAEKPDEMLDLSYEQMLDQITQVKRGLVSITASRKQLELQEQQLQHTVDHLNDQAKAALAQGKEDLAREALSRKAAAQAQIDGIGPQRQQLGEEQEKLEQTLAALQKRVNDFRTQKEVLKLLLLQLELFAGRGDRHQPPLDLGDLVEHLLVGQVEHLVRPLRGVERLVGLGLEYVVRPLEEAHFDVLLIIEGGAAPVPPPRRPMGRRPAAMAGPDTRRLPP